MRSTWLFLGFIATVVSYKTKVNRTVIPDVYIVQLSNDSTTSTFPDKILDHHAKFHKRAEGIDYDVRTEFRSPDLFYGLSIKINENLTAEEVTRKILEMSDVKGIWPVYLVTAPEPYGINFNSSMRLNMSSSGLNDHVRDAQQLIQIRGDLDIQSTHKMAEVDRVHELGIKGKGIQIAILDTGVDYRHPSLGGGFGPGFKIAGGYAFLQDHWQGGEAIESPDPLATCFDGGHGTHVTGEYDLKIAR